MGPCYLFVRYCFTLLFFVLLCFYCVFRERTIYPDITSVSQRFNSIKTISHELTHKWFGNLVTPAEFSYLWLKEGFATLFGSFAPHRLYPEMRYMDYFVAEMCQSVKATTDALRETRPMSLEVHARDSIQGIYDDIAYSKCEYFFKILH